VFKGSFTRNDQFASTPFKNMFNYIPNVPFSVAKKVPDQINKTGKKWFGGSSYEERVDDMDVDERYHEWMWKREESVKDSGSSSQELENATLGYVTQDSCPGKGDDTLHIQAPSYSIPLFVSSPLPNVTDDTLVDVVFISFVESDILTILNMFWNKTVTKADVKVYSTVKSNEALGVYAQLAWNGAT